VIVGAANEIAVMANAVTQMTQDLRLSTVLPVAADVILEETLVSAGIIEIPELVAEASYPLASTRRTNLAVRTASDRI
jgi:hypothetical protein